MKYDIKYEEVIWRTNTITIEVEDEDEGLKISKELAVLDRQWKHPDDAFEAAAKMGLTIISRSDGAPNSDYEVL